MGLPKQIQKQIKKADKIIADANTPPVENPEETPVPVEASQVAPEPEAPEPTPEPAPENFEQKYKVLQGKYDSEVPKLHRDLQAALGRIDEQQASVHRFHL